MLSPIVGLTAPLVFQKTDTQGSSRRSSAWGRAPQASGRLLWMLAVAFQQLMQGGTQEEQGRRMGGWERRAPCPEALPGGWHLGCAWFCRVPTLLSPIGR